MAVKKIGRDAFLYLEARNGEDDFAQCSDCGFFTGSRCAVIGTPVSPKASCGFFANGAPGAQTVRKMVTSKEAGLVLEPVRCENCVYGGTDCKLYQRLNATLPATFALDTAIKPKACCNAFTPGGS